MYRETRTLLPIDSNLVFIIQGSGGKKKKKKNTVNVEKNACAVVMRMRKL